MDINVIKPSSRWKFPKYRIVVDGEYSYVEKRKYFFFYGYLKLFTTYGEAYEYLISMINEKRKNEIKESRYFEESN